MENPGALISWMYEAVANLPASLSDPKYWDAIFAVMVLMILYSLVSSIKRLNDRVASVSSELSAIRSALTRMEWSLRPRGDEEGKDLRDLLFRMENDPPK